MTRHGVVGILLVTVALTGCDKIGSKIPFFGKKPPAARPGTPAGPPPVAAAPATSDTTKVSAKAVARRAVAPVDEPWTPTDTGTVTPGMTREQVIATWGVPVTERNRDNWGYLYFRNGCEATCGTFDVVFLENGQVVDAVVRGPGHTYAGNSSSPAGRTPEPTTGSMTLPATPPDSAPPPPQTSTPGAAT